MSKREYTVRFGGLPTGIHEYEFEIGESFFKDFESSNIERAQLHVKAVLTKQNNLLQMHFDFEGTVGVACDRCLKDFDYPIEGVEDLVIRHGNPDESSDEILVIPEGADSFDVAHYLYEYIMVSIPARVVPCEVDSEAFECDEETLSKLESHEAEDEAEDSGPENNVWEALNKIKFNKN